jgi:hypothetical protein
MIVICLHGRFLILCSKLLSARLCVITAEAIPIENKIKRSNDAEGYGFPHVVALFFFKATRHWRLCR